jgi:NitT/TauT family transport system permease protein
MLDEKAAPAPPGSDAPLDQEPASVKWKYRIGTILTGFLFFALWEALPRLGLVHPIVLPPFTDTIRELVLLVQTDFFPRHFFVTLNNVFWGFVIGTTLGLTVGIMLGVWGSLRRLTYPFVVAFQAIPKIVLAPLFIAWFGFGQTSKIVMAIAIGFFPVLINTMVGIENVPNDMVRLMRSVRASRWQIFKKVELPNAAPLIFAGIKASLTFSLIGAIVGEFVGSSEGLGFLLDTYNFQLKIDRVFSVIIILSLIGAAFYFTLEWLDKRLIFWRQES